MERDDQPLSLEELCFVLEQQYDHKMKLTSISKLLRRSPEAFDNLLAPYKQCLSLNELYNKFNLRYNNIEDVRRRSKSFMKILLARELQYFI